MKRHYKAEINRDGRWWMVAIPEIDGLTQARRLTEAELMAREYIAIDTATPIEDINVTITSVTIPGLGDVKAIADDIAELRDAARQAEAAATAAMQDYAKHATKAGIPVRDTAELLGVSPQRISQLANT